MEHGDGNTGRGVNAGRNRQVEVQALPGSHGPIGDRKWRRCLYRAEGQGQDQRTE